MLNSYLVLVLLLASIQAFSQTGSSLQQARKQYEEDNYAEAIKLLEKAALEEPANAQVPYLTGRAYLDMNNYRKAATYLEKAISMDSTKPHWIYECGLIYYAIPDDRNALKFILLAGEKGYKKSSDYLENLGNIYLNLGDYLKGIETLSAVLTKKPSDRELLYSIGEAYYKLGKYEEAIGYWDRVLAEDKSNADALFMIGMSYQKKGDKEKGRQLCDRAIEMDPSLRSKRQRTGGDL